MAKKNNTANKPVYKDFDDEVIPNDFIFEGYQLKRNNERARKIHGLIKQEVTKYELY